MPAQTQQPAARRQVSYASLSELLADAERLAAGPAKTVGGWSLGQIFTHLAIGLEGSVNGYTVKPCSWPVRWVARTFILPRFLKKGMPAGFKLKGDAAQKLVPPPTTTEAGLNRLRAAIALNQATEVRHMHPIFGQLPQAVCDRLHLRHAELHMSFAAPE